MYTKKKQQKKDNQKAERASLSQKKQKTRARKVLKEFKNHEEPQSMKQRGILCTEDRMSRNCKLQRAQVEGSSTTACLPGGCEANNHGDRAGEVVDSSVSRNFFGQYSFNICLICCRLMGLARKQSIPLSKHCLIFDSSANAVRAIIGNLWPSSRM